MLQAGLTLEKTLSRTLLLNRALGMAQMRFHDLRHNDASLMLAAGSKPDGVSYWLGHANVSTTDGIDAHLYRSGYNEQIVRLKAFVAEPAFAVQRG